MSKNWPMLIPLVYLSIAVCQAETRGRLFVFGDDLGDTGNLRQLTNNSDIGYNEGRLTNGPVFTEYMATALDRKLSTFSYAQSTVNETWASAGWSNGKKIPSLEDQVVEFAKAERDWIRRKTEPRKSLVVVSAGSSDVLCQHHQPHSTLTKEFAKNLVTGIFTQVDAIHKLGIDSILVTNLPALYILPRWQQSSQIDLMREFVKSANTLFREQVVEYQETWTDTRLWLLDAEEFMLVAANTSFAQTIGARNTTGACITQNGSCEDPMDYVFYDDIHMDMRLHHLLGLVAASLIQGNDVQYNATFLGQIAQEYDIGVLYHKSTTIVEDYSSTGELATSTSAADPLLTSTASSMANCSLTAVCTVVSLPTASMAVASALEPTMGAKAERQHPQGSSASRVGCQVNHKWYSFGGYIALVAVVAAIF